MLSYHLEHLTRTDSENYIRHRLRVASNGGGTRADFADQALNEIYSATDGIPRLINVLCDNALLVGYAREQTRIDEFIITVVLRDMTCWGLQTSSAAGGAGLSPDGGVGG